MADENGPTGVGGWMWLFLFGFGVASPFMLLFSSYSNLYGDPTVAAVLGSSWGIYQVVEWALVVLSLAIIGFIVWRLFKVQNQRTVRLTQMAIPVLAVGTTLLDILVTAVFAKVDMSLLFSAMGTDLVRGVAYSLIWVSYFQVSKRVKNTYFEHAAGDAAQVFE
jgi:hypothetical protein